MGDDLKFEWTWVVYKGEPQDYLDECRMCAAVVPLRNFPINDFRNDETEDERYLCDLCASTAAGSAQEYPRQYIHSFALMQVVNYGNNMILLQLGKFGDKPTVNPAVGTPKLGVV